MCLVSFPSQGLNDENTQPFQYGNLPTSLYPTDQLREMSNRNHFETPKFIQSRTKPEPSAPPLTPQITMRRPKPKTPCHDKILIDQEATPTALPRSTSLCASIVPRDIPPRLSNESNLTEDEDPNANIESTEDPILKELTMKAKNLTLDQLRARLKRHVFSPGPLDNTNRRLYERKLAVLDFNLMRGVEYEMKRKQMGFSKLEIKL